MNGLTLVDWIIVVVLVVAVLAGIAQGFFRSAFSLAGLVLGLVLAAWNYWRLSRQSLKPLMHSVEVANAIAFLLIALLVMVVAAILGSLLAKMFQKVGLGCLDSLAGAVFGFVQGIVLVTVCHSGYGGVLPGNAVADGIKAAAIFLWCTPSERPVSPPRGWADGCGRN